MAHVLYRIESCSPPGSLLIPAPIHPRWTLGTRREVRAPYALHLPSRRTRHPAFLVEYAREVYGGIAPSGHLALRDWRPDSLQALSVTDMGLFHTT